MPTRSIVLRVLLGLCLILNGVGTATAAMQMEAKAIAGNEMASDMTDSTSTTDADCHDRAMATDPDHGNAMEHDGTSSPHPSPDCCKYGACQCACAQHAQVTIALFVAAGSIGVTGISLHALADGRPAPVPGALLRPPIA